MKLAEERHVAAEPFVVWAAVLSPEVLTQSVPGCENLTGNAAEGIAAVVGQKVGPVKARFSAKVTLCDIGEGQSLRISGEGHGFAKGADTVSTAAAESGGTTRTYTVTPVPAVNLRNWPARSSTALQEVWPGNSLTGSEVPSRPLMRRSKHPTRRAMPWRAIPKKAGSGV